MIGAYTDLTTGRTFFKYADGSERGVSMKAPDFCFYMSGPIESFQQAAWDDYNPSGIYA